MRHGRSIVPVGVAVALAVAAFGFMATLAYDAWAWMVWAREIVHFDLDTTGGPSWKPLPVLVALPLTAVGDLAPTLWLVVSRTVGLLSLVAAFQVARRLAGSRVRRGWWAVVAGTIAAVFLALTPDPAPRLARLIIEGHSAAWTAALALWAVDRHLAGRPRQTLVLLTLLSLDRPEAWPFLAAYAVWLWRGEPRYRRLIVGLLVAVPVLWFGIDWWGAGSPFHGADVAQRWGDGAVPFAEAWLAFLQMVPVPIWLLALVSAGRAWWSAPVARPVPWPLPVEVMLVGSALG